MFTFTETENSSNKDKMKTGKYYMLYFEEEN